MCLRGFISSFTYSLSELRLPVLRSYTFSSITSNILDVDCRDLQQGCNDVVRTNYHRRGYTNVLADFRPVVNYVGQELF